MTTHRTGKDLILATKPFVREDRNRSWLYTLSTLGLLMAALVGTLLHIPAFAKLGFSILAGLLLVRMFVIYHDHQHYAILHQSKLAEFIMKLFGGYILAPSSIWKRSHDFHHKHNSKLHVTDIGSFPTITKNQFLTMSDSERRTYLIMRHPLNIALGYISIFMYSFCIHSVLNSRKKHWDCGLALVFHFAFGAFLIDFGGFSALFFTLLLPHLIACGIGSYLFYAQHNFPEASFRAGHDWEYAYAAITSTSHFRMNPMMRWFTANIGFHHVHHLNSKVPFYRLEEATKALPELVDAPVTSFKFSDVAACLRLKLWDEEKGKMIGLEELRKQEPVGA
jgi:omega-6 fatty acid desaturase (delta-12 desaturase)